MGVGSSIWTFKKSVKQSHQSKPLDPRMILSCFFPQKMLADGWKEAI